MRLAHRYELGERLGVGGLGTTYRARDRLLDMNVALKVVRAHEGRGPLGANPVAQIAPLKSEFVALKTSRHPRLLHVLDFGFSRVDDDASHVAYFSSELIEGDDLSTYAKGRTFEDLARPIGHALSALGFLHARRILHGDVHPKNVLVTRAGNGVLIDLSCVSRLDGARLDHLSGTPGFFAPERLRGEASVRAELFAVGKALAVLERQLRSALPPHVQDAVARLLDADPTRRPANVEETAALLRIELEPWSRLSGAFVGRANEIGAFESMLRQLKANTPGPRVLMFTGPEGVGLTRLLDELKTLAQLSVPVVVETSANTTAPVRALLESVGVTELSSKQAVLRALDDLESRDEQTVFLVDDADRLSAIDRDWLTTLARAIPSDGKVALILSGRTPLGDGPTSKEVKVKPLGAGDLEVWLVDAPRHVIPSIVAATGGIPREVDTLANLLETRGWDSRAMERAAIDVAAQSAPIAGGATVPERHALALLVASGGQLDRKAATHLSVVQVFRGAALAPLVVEEAAGFRFHRRSQALRVRLSDSEVTQAHLELAGLLRGDPEPTRSLSLRARHLLRGGAIVEGASVFREALRAHLSLGLVPAADAIVEARPPAPLDLLLEAATVYESAGDARRSLTVLTHVLRARPPSAIRGRLRRIAGGCYARLGDSRRAIRSLRLALVTPEPGQRAGVASDLSLALLKKGDHEDAERVVREALATEPSTPASIDLAINGAFAASYRGDTSTARAYLERARNAIQEELPNLGKVVGPRHDYRLRNATAFVSYRAGAVSSALEMYVEALEIAESAGLDDLLAPAALNVGTAAHQLGDLARAISAYARGQRAALAFGMPTTELMLALNSARGWLDAGQFARARLGAGETFARAEREGVPFVAAAALCTAGEGAFLDGDGGEGRTLTSQACDRLVGLGAKREALEAKMVLASIDLAAGASSAAEQSLRQLQREIDEIDAGDLRARWTVLLAECQMRALRGAEAVALLEKAATLARESGRRLLIAEISLALSAAYLAQGATELATTLRRSARGEVERTSSMLPPDLRASFEAHPTWRPLFSAERERPPAERGTTMGRIEAADLERLFEITRRLNSAASTEAILEEAMDAAISLTRAERGFLLLPDPNKPRAVKVAVARNLDRERLRSGTMKFSRTIAERVLRTGEPVVATDASIDPRFSRARSVHALGLKSVLSVPIRSKDRILGAIYVDHRFHPDSFSGSEVKLAGLLADQAALVLGRAQLIDELRRKTADLERKSAEVEELARAQAVELHRLNESSTPRETRRALRYDYGALVANSSPMRRVLEVLDRVIAADVTVLIQGESGTGKERIARAIHENGARARKPFVAINCGALPEALLEGELFGYRKGAFSGAARDHDGLFVAAHGGTLFLDELGEMPASMQVKLLRALQQREIRPLGSNDSVIVDVRVLAATNRKLVDETRAGRFREDLYYRIAVVEISLPPLRERFEDILPLASTILERLAVEHSRPRASLERSAERALLKQSWPGNVRQLENVLTKAFLLAGTARIGEEELELETKDVSRTDRSRRRRDVTRAEMVTALDAAGWNVVEAARKLTVPRATFYRMLRRFELRRHDS